MILPDVTLLIQMINFFILLFLMNMILFRPIRRLVAERNRHMEDQQQGIERADAEGLAAVREFEERIQEARNAGRQRVQEMKEAAYLNEKDLLQRAGEEAAAQVQDLRARIRSDARAAREQLSSQVQAFATDLAQKILGRSI